MNERQEVLSGFLIARRHAALLLDPVYEPFHQVSLPVEVTVNLPRVFAIRSRRDHSLGSDRLDLRDQGVAVVPLVGDHGVGRQSLDQRSALADVRRLAPGHDEPDGVAQGVDGDVHLGACPSIHGQMPQVWCSKGLAMFAPD